MSLGPILKELRITRKLSLREVEQGTGISNGYISQLESGKVKKPSVFFIHKLANLYGYTIDEILEMSGFIKPVFLRKKGER